MDQLPFLPVLGKICIFAFPVFFTFIIVCKLLGEKASKFLKTLKRLTSRKIFQFLLFSIGCIIGILVGLKYGFTDSVLNVLLACLSGLLAGFIIAGIAYTIMHRLSDYLTEEK